MSQISKKTRFEIFKRDGFRCLYCGATPPKAVLEVDHIQPISAGGPNDDENLATACFDCNRGKSAWLMSQIPPSLEDQATLVAEREFQLAGYQAVLAARRERIENDAWDVIYALTGENICSHGDFSSVRNFVDRMGKDLTFEAVEITRGKQWIKNPFHYFCGVCWKLIRDGDL